ncbi:uncharacterized protein V2V93DRAFT_390183 [Kockiozyma suomiensis]|uniref:uncharacterized protein n=1 Tax=Kockiozyma suomiensis TaxID=1337062 RepID=UPI0033434A85
MLNIDSNLSSTWNNMGYWPIREPGYPPSTAFASAATCLATKLATAAELKSSDTLLDIGIGCGDQALVYAPLVKKYIGVTSLAEHASLAHDKLEKKEMLDKASVYALDCSSPNERTWPTALLNSVVLDGSVNKIIALDCLYHFSPSRENFLHFASASLEAAYERLRNEDQSGCQVSFVAEDMLLASRPLPIIKMLGLRIICSLSQSPLLNFKTADEYRSMLQDSGFGSSRGWTIEMQDISDRVFPGLADFLDERGSARDGIGRWLRFERFTYFGKVVRWWYEQHVIRAFIISATKRS